MVLAAAITGPPYAFPVLPRTTNEPVETADFAAVTAVISNAYAERYRILPVAVTKVELIVATSEPFVPSGMSREAT